MLVVHRADSMILARRVHRAARTMATLRVSLAVFTVRTLGDPGIAILASGFVIVTVNAITDYLDASMLALSRVEEHGSAPRGRLCFGVIAMAGDSTTSLAPGFVIVAVIAIVDLFGASMLALSRVADHGVAPLEGWCFA
jgi:hypothetical protein